MSGLVALIGDPVAHSVSPQLQNAAFRAASLDWEYRAIRVAREDLPAEFARLRRDARGLNVTIPHKEAVLPLLDELAPAARAAGSVNTVVLAGGRAVGTTTDGGGFYRALARAAPGITFRRAIVLGAGGAARAVAAALEAHGATVWIVGRDPARASVVARDTRARPLTMDAVPAALAEADLLVNATPVGSPEVSGSPLPDGIGLPRALTVFDLVYRPRRTRLLDRAARAGCRTVEGVEMLVEQGALSFEAWTGRPAPLDVMREAAYAALDADPTADRARPAVAR